MLAVYSAERCFPHRSFSLLLVQARRRAWQDEVRQDFITLASAFNAHVETSLQLPDYHARHTSKTTVVAVFVFPQSETCCAHFRFTRCCQSFVLDTQK